MYYSNMYYSNQNSLALISNLDSGFTFAVLKSNLSLSSGWRCRSDSKFSQTLLITDMNRSRIPSCLSATKPPFLQECAWLMETRPLQAH